VLPGFPVILGNASVVDGAVLHDLDRDGVLEILYSGSSHLYVIESDGSLWGGAWPVALSADAHGTPAIGDVDGDGMPEIFASGTGSLSLIEADGSMVTGWPMALWHGDEQLERFTSGVLADLDADGDLESIIAGGYRGTAVDDNNDEVSAWFFEVHALHHDGTPVTGWPQQLPPTRSVPFASSSPLVTDLEGDGVPEVVLGHSSLTNKQPMIFAWDAGGKAKSGFPYQFPEDFAGWVTVLTAADINGDGLMEVLATRACRTPRSSLGGFSA